MAREHCPGDTFNPTWCGLCLDDWPCAAKKAADPAWASKGYCARCGSERPRDELGALPEAAHLHACRDGAACEARLWG